VSGDATAVMLCRSWGLTCSARRRFASARFSRCRVLGHAVARLRSCMLSGICVVFPHTRTNTPQTLCSDSCWLLTRRARAQAARLDDTFKQQRQRGAPSAAADAGGANAGGAKRAAPAPAAAPAAGAKRARVQPQPPATPQPARAAGQAKSRASAAAATGALPETAAGVQGAPAGAGALAGCTLVILVSIGGQRRRLADNAAAAGARVVADVRAPGVTHLVVEADAGAAALARGLGRPELVPEGGIDGPAAAAAAAGALAAALPAGAAFVAAEWVAARREQGDAARAQDFPVDAMGALTRGAAGAPARVSPEREPSGAPGGAQVTAARDTCSAACPPCGHFVHLCTAWIRSAYAWISL